MNVAQSGRLIRVRTDKDVQFTAALATGVGLQATLAAATQPAGYPTPLAARMRAILRAIKILSKENLDWEVWLFGTSSFATTDADTEVFLGRWSFIAADGIRATIGVTTDTYYHYYIDGLQVVLTDASHLGNIYIRLVNRSVASKSAGANGEIVIELVLEPTQGA